MKHGTRLIDVYYDTFKAVLEPLGVQVRLEFRNTGHPMAICTAPNGVTRSRPVAGSPTNRDLKVRENYARQDAKRMAQLLGVL